MKNNLRRSFFKLMYTLETALRTFDEEFVTSPKLDQVVEILLWRFVLSNFLTQHISETKPAVEVALGLHKSTAFARFLDSILPLPNLRYSTLSSMERILVDTGSSFLWDLSRRNDSIDDDRVVTPKDFGDILQFKPDTRLGVAITPNWLAGYMVASSIKRLVKHEIGLDLSLEYEEDHAALRVPDSANRAILNNLEYRLRNLRILDISVGYGAFYFASLLCLKRLLSDVTRLQMDENYVGCEMKQLLLACDSVYGIDIDPLATAICKAQLALIQSSEILNTYRVLELEKLAQYISRAHLYVGNSIIGEAKTDQRLDKFFDQIAKRQNSMCDPSFLTTLNPFAWASMVPEVIDSGGFDIVVGNPPYVGYRYISRDMKQTLREFYPQVFEGTADLQTYFIARAVELTRPSGQISLLISRYFLEARYAERMRREIDSKTHLWKVVDLREAKPFAGKSNNVAIIFLTNTRQYSDTVQTRIHILKGSVRPKSLSKHDFLELNMEDPEQSFDSFDVIRPRGSWEFVAPQKMSLSEKIKRTCVPLGSLCFVGTGYHTGNDRIFSANISTRGGRFFGAVNVDGEIQQVPLEKELIRPIIKTTDILPFAVEWKPKFLLFIWNVGDILKYPCTSRYLDFYRSELEKRYEVRVKGGKWYELARVRNAHIFASEKKIVCPYRTPILRFALDDQRKLHSIDCTSIVPKTDCTVDIFYLLGVLNSRLIDFAYRLTAKKLDAKKLELYPRPLSLIPIKLPQSEKESQLAHQISQRSQELVSKIRSSRILRKNKMSLLIDARSISRSRGSQFIQDKNAGDLWETIKQIDSLVFEIYGLSDGEKKLVTEAKGGV